MAPASAIAFWFSGWPDERASRAPAASALVFEWLSGLLSSVTSIWMPFSARIAFLLRSDVRQRSDRQAAACACAAAELDARRGTRERTPPAVAIALTFLSESPERRARTAAASS